MIAPDLVERIAAAIHARYIAEQTLDGATLDSSPALVPWTELDDDKREANRDQARDIAAKLARIGCAVVPVDDPATDEFAFAFTDAELERLSRDEHRRWSRQRRSAGWVYGAARDDRSRRHPSLVPWSKLSEPERDKDRDAVRNIPAVLAAAGLRVVRLTGT